MPLDDVLDYLRKRPDEWLTTTDIAKAINFNSGTVGRLLNSLLYRGHILKKMDYDHRMTSGCRKILFWRFKE